MAGNDDKIKASGGGLSGGSTYPIQFIIIIALFVVFSVGYLYFTSIGEESGSAGNGMQQETQEQTAETG